MRAFDKAVRRKPLAFAAGAGALWELHVGEEGRAGGGEERVEQSGRSHVLRGGCIGNESACEARSGWRTRHKSA